MAARIPMTTITTRSSTIVKALKQAVDEMEVDFCLINLRFII